MVIAYSLGAYCILDKFCGYFFDVFVFIVMVCDGVCWPIY